MASLRRLALLSICLHQDVSGSHSGVPTCPLQLRQASWDRQLDAYTRPQGGSPSAQRSLRARLVEAVKAAHQSPEAWWTLLQQEEGWAAAAGATASLERGAAARGGVSLADLYAAATKVVPRQNNYSNDAFIKIWLGFARQQWCDVFTAWGGQAGYRPVMSAWRQPTQGMTPNAVRPAAEHAPLPCEPAACPCPTSPSACRRARNPDDARDVFKMLKSQHIGDQHAALYYEWAALEAAGGNEVKALGVLGKGMKEQAQPAWCVRAPACPPALLRQAAHGLCMLAALCIKPYRVMHASSRGWGWR